MNRLLIAKLPYLLLYEVALQNALALPDASSDLFAEKTSLLLQKNVSGNGGSRASRGTPPPVGMGSGWGSRSSITPLMGKPLRAQLAWLEPPGPTPGAGSKGCRDKPCFHRSQGRWAEFLSVWRCSGATSQGPLRSGEWEGSGQRVVSAVLGLCSCGRWDPGREREVGEDSGLPGNRGRRDQESFSQGVSFYAKADFFRYTRTECFSPLKFSRFLMQLVAANLSV